MKCGKSKLRYEGYLLRLINKKKIMLFLPGQARDASVGLDINKLSCGQSVEILAPFYKKIVIALLMKLMNNLKHFVEGHSICSKQNICKNSRLCA